MSQKKTADGDGDRQERERSFTRRGLMQWTVPALVIAATAARTRYASAGGEPVHQDLNTHIDEHSDHNDSHYDSIPPGGHGDHSDGTTHGDIYHGDHNDVECPIHQDTHTDYTHADTSTGGGPAGPG